MDKLEIAKIVFARPGQVARVEAIPVCVTLRANNWNFPDALDVVEFLKSLHTGARLPLFMCAVCGEVCGSGYYVDIQISKQYWQISNRYDAYDSEKLIEDFSYEIPWWQIVKILGQLRTAIQIIPDQYPYLLDVSGIGWLRLVPSLDREIARLSK